LVAFFEAGLNGRERALGFAEKYRVACRLWSQLNQQLLGAILADSIDDAADSPIRLITQASTGSDRVMPVVERVIK
jgi:hypothetical protein